MIQTLIATPAATLRTAALLLGCSYLDGRVVRPEGHVVPPNQRERLLPAQKQLQVREELCVLLGGQGQQRADAAGDGGVQQELLWREEEGEEVNTL